MSNALSSQYQSHGWLDSLAISMSALCAIHCLVTPFIVIALPVFAATFWAHKNFHLWMILLVVSTTTTTTAMFLGCRKHKDGRVLALGALGLAILTAVALHESLSHVPLGLRENTLCSHCTHMNQATLLPARPRQT